MLWKNKFLQKRKKNNNKQMNKIRYVQIYVHCNLHIGIIL